MAVVRFLDGGDDTISAERGAELWAILSNETEGSEEDERYCSRISKLYLNWRVAPDSYIKDRLDIIGPMIAGRYMMEVEPADNFGHHRATGKILGPDPTNTAVYEFSEKWGISKNGHLTPLGFKYANSK